ncbi:sigma 54 modulation protein [Ehrlichia ruminantium]|uniref:Ribosome hibernation promoting factor n=1 Tax=Ehrlichia ruminantium TaxID=779 RepID=A0A170RUU9_EHRRU|nr:ribosome-associated translation inhibitor RaiA [Ehrlichia ruminantium]GAT75259.1 sigma 54 modulation protein [Ehrlichia ruminantium]GAT77249.1 sigma 54 modulation protein [Ehrlichia ruminantium]GAT78336.1 sigma 54 modulation protein [Ehrlichia ruminantium]
MNIVITTRGFDITDNIRSYIEKGIDDHIAKFFCDDSTVTVKMILSKDANLFNANIAVSDVKGEFIRISKTADTAYHAIDNVISYLSDRLKQHKSEKINKYRHNKHSIKSQMKCFGYVLNKDEIEKYDIDNDTHNHTGLVIEEDVIIKTMTIGDAIMEMELLSLPALLFINVKNNRVNMIYTRNDGSIIWVDPLNVSSM